MQEFGWKKIEGFPLKQIILRKFTFCSEPIFISNDLFTFECQQYRLIIMCPTGNSDGYEKCNKFKLPSTLWPTFTTICNQNQIRIVITFLNALQLCDFNEIFNASFIIIYCTFWFDVIIALLNFDLGRERVFFFSILLFAYFAVVQFLRNILCTHILLLYFCTIKLLYFKLLYAFETYKANMNELDFLEVAKCFFLWMKFHT